MLWIADELGKLELRDLTVCLCLQLLFISLFRVKQCKNATHCDFNLIIFDKYNNNSFITPKTPMPFFYIYTSALNYAVLL